MATNVFAELNSHTTPSNDPNMFTSGEYAKAVGVAQGTAQRRLRLLEEKGLVERCTVLQQRGKYVYPSAGWRYIGDKVIGKKGQVVGGRGKSGAGDAEVKASLAKGNTANGGGSGKQADVRRSTKRSEVSST